MLKNKTKELLKGINLNFIYEEMFKTTGIAVNFFIPLSKENASKNALLSKILTRSCKKYPSFISLNKRLEELYGASIESSVAKMGDNQVISICASCVKDKFAIDGELITSRVTEILCEMIFNPDLREGNFKEENINAEKRELIEVIEAIYNDKKAYAYRKCEKIMCSGEKFEVSKYGELDDVKKITKEDVLYAWQNLLKTAKIEIIILGGVSYENFSQKFKENFSKIERNYQENFKTQITKKAKKAKEIEEIASISQNKLVMGFRTGISENDNFAFEVNSMSLMIAILGGTPHSKLFLNVREKLSLCYYCSAAYNSNKGFMFIQSGVEKENIEKAKEEILKQIENLKIGNFSDEELTANKMLLMQSVQKTGDSTNSLVRFYISQIFSKEKQTPEEILNDFKKITRNDIIKSAEKLSLDTVFKLIND